MLRKQFYLFLLLIISVQLFSQQPVFTKIRLPKEIKIINCMERNADNALWMGTNTGIYVIENDKIKYHYFQQNDPVKFKANCLLFDSVNNCTWYGTYRSSVVQFTDSSHYSEISFSTVTGNSNYLITSLGLFQNVLYAGTSEGQIIAYDIKNKTSKLIASPTKNPIMGYVKDNELNVQWACCIDGIYFKRKEGEWKLMPGYYTMYGIFKKGDEYWAAGRNMEIKATLTLLFKDFSIFKQNNKKWRELLLINLTDQYAKFNDIGFTPDDMIWIATNNGVVFYNPFDASCLEINKTKYPTFLVENAVHLAVMPDKSVYVASDDCQFLKIEFIK